MHYNEEENYMAVKIRLKRMGAKKRPFYRVIVANSRAPRDGKFIEEIGYYNPLTSPVEINIDSEKATKWLSCGAQPTDTVKNLFQKVGITKPAVSVEAPATDKSEVVEPEVAQ
jgi:small subunit ribosomal protein S16